MVRRGVADGRRHLSMLSDCCISAQLFSENYLDSLSPCGPCGSHPDARCYLDRDCTRGRLRTALCHCPISPSHGDDPRIPGEVFLTSPWGTMLDHLCSSTYPPTVLRYGWENVQMQNVKPQNSASSITNQIFSKCYSSPGTVILDMLWKI
jgi:hypothetical protein